MGAVQAAATVAVVVYTERTTRKAVQRDEVERRAAQREAVATLTRLAYTSFNEAVGLVISTTTTQQLERMFSKGRSDGWLSALRRHNVAELGEADLLAHFLSFRAALEGALAEVQTAIEKWGGASLNFPTAKTNARAFVGSFGVDLFNKAAAVERTVARLNRREEHRLPDPFTG